MKRGDFKTRLANVLGGGGKLKKLPHHILIPIGLVVLVILLIGFKLVVGFHHYQQRSAEAALRSLHAAGASDGTQELNRIGAEAAVAYGTIAPPLPALTEAPRNLKAGTAEQTVTCPGAAPSTATIATVSAVFVAPSNAGPGCTVTWRFYSRTEQSDGGFGHIQGLINGKLVNLPTGEIVTVNASGSPAATLVAAIDGGNTMNLAHPIDSDLASVNGAAVGEGWHKYTVSARVIGDSGPRSGEWSPSKKPLTVRLTAGANPAIPFWIATGANPHNAQQAAASTTTAVAPAAVAPAASIQPPEGIAAGWITRKSFSRDRFGSLVQVSAAAEQAAALTVTAPARAGNAPGQRVEWSGWIKLDVPASVAVLRLAGGQGTVSASVDGMPVGQPVERWPQSPATTQTASVSLSTGWHQFVITDDEAAGTWGDGSSIQIAIGDGSTDPQPPVPFAVLPHASTTSPIPHIAQHQHAAASSSPVAKPAASTTTGASK